MGLSFSFMDQNGGSAAGPSPEPGLGDFPESCVASVLVYLDPPQICRIAGLNRAFRGASYADFVWESKLPVKCNSVLHRVFGQEYGVFCEGSCKRVIYSTLCRPNTFDGGTKITGIDAGDTGVEFQLKNRGSSLLHISSKYGGSKSTVRLSSHSHPASTASLSIYIWDEPKRDSEGAFATQDMCTVGTKNLFDSISQLLKARR